MIRVTKIWEVSPNLPFFAVLSCNKFDEYVRPELDKALAEIGAFGEQLMRGLLWTGLHEIEAYAVFRIGLRQGNYLFILENGAPQKPHGAVNIAIKRCDDEALVPVRVLQNIVANFFSVLTSRYPRAYARGPKNQNLTG